MTKQEYIEGILQESLAQYAKPIQDKSYDLYRVIGEAVETAANSCPVFLDWVMSDKCQYLSKGNGQWHHIMNKSDIVTSRQLHLKFLESCPNSK